MGPRASRNCVTVVPLGHSRFTSRRVSSGMGSKPGDFSDMGHLVSGSKMGGHLPPNGYTLSLSIPDGTRQLVRTEFPNRVINRALLDTFKWYKSKYPQCVMHCLYSSSY